MRDLLDYLDQNGGQNQRRWYDNRSRSWVMHFEDEIRGHETSLVAQWLRICLPMQGTLVRSLVQEDPTCCGATKPVSHHYWACALEPASHIYRAHVLQVLKAVRLEPVLHNKSNKRSTTMRSPRTTAKSNPRWPQLEKSPRAATKTQCSQKNK